MVSYYESYSQEKYFINLKIGSVCFNNYRKAAHQETILVFIIDY